jgi:hypothetical protein
MPVSLLQGEERWLLLKVDLSQQTLSKPCFPGYALFLFYYSLELQRESLNKQVGTGACQVNLQWHQ